jgi:transcriptional regulator with XRE-family HTH domain
MSLMVADDDRIPAMLASARRMTGWSWEQLARCLGYDVQDLYAWRSGAAPEQAAIDRLSNLHDALAYIDTGSAETNRSFLNRKVEGGTSASDLLDQGMFEEVSSLLGKGQGRRDISHLVRQANEIIRGDQDHWYDRLLTAKGVEVFVEPLGPVRKRRVAVRREHPKRPA